MTFHVEPTQSVAEQYRRHLIEVRDAVDAGKIKEVRREMQKLWDTASIAERHAIQAAANAFAATRGL